MTGHELLYRFIKKIKKRSQELKDEAHKAHLEEDLGTKIWNNSKVEILDEIVACYEELQKEIEAEQ